MVSIKTTLGSMPALQKSRAEERIAKLETACKAKHGEEFELRDDSVLAMHYATGLLPQPAFGFGMESLVLELGEIQRLYSQTNYHELLEKSFKPCAEQMARSQKISHTTAYNILKDLMTPIVRAQVYIEAIEQAC